MIFVCVKIIFFMKFKIVIVILLLLTVFGLEYLWNTRKNYYHYNNNRNNILIIGETIFNLEIADSNEKRIKGLSYRYNLPKDSVLLFVFEKEDFHGIWMKNMYFPIDIVWLDKNKQVVHIEENIYPNTFPKVFMPTQKSLYVLEFNQGVIKEKNIKIGNSVKF